MIIHFFTKGDQSVGSSRQRGFLVANELDLHGFKTIVCQPSVSLISKTKWPQKTRLILESIGNLLSVKKNDVIFLQRVVYNKYFVSLLILHKLIFKRKMIFDFDDAIYLNSPAKTKMLTKLSDAVIVGSHALHDWAKKYNDEVYIVPTSVKFEKYVKYTRDYSKRNEKFTIGWIGGAIDQYENLKLLVPVFDKLIQEKIAIKFILIGALGHKKVYDLFKNVKGLELEFIDSLNWSNPDAVPANIQKFDVGVMPLVDNEWNCGKCSFKAIEYMACGVSAVISAVGENNYLIQDGINGYLATSTSQWAQKIITLYNNTELIAEIGLKGQETIRNEYSYEVTIQILLSILNNLQKC